MATDLPIDPNTEPYRYLGFIQNPDGSVTRASDSDLIPNAPPSHDHGNPYPALSKDLTFNQENQNWARLYIPKEPTPPNGSKLPLVVYFHGGGFVLGSPAATPFHMFCSQLASRIPAVVVSAKYRLAPEHRLPAAYDDAAEFIHWLDAVEDDWLAEYADLSKSFLMGISAGANVAYRVGLRAATRVQRRIKIQGLILHHLFFGGVQRTPSETKLINDPIIPLRVADIMWDLALPIGADRDHEYCNFTTAPPSSDVLEDVKKWRVLVTGCDGDPLVDRQRQLAEMLRGKGVDVAAEFSDGGCHGVELLDEARADVLYGLVKSFVHSL